MRPTHCAHCAAPLPETKRDDAVYCSDACGQRAWLARYKAQHGIAYHCETSRDRRAQGRGK